MDDFVYTQEYSYYNDLYDLLTIKDCLETIELHTKVHLKFSQDKRYKALPDAEKKKVFYFPLNIDLFIRKADHWKNKKSTIEQWLERDKNKDEKLNTACPPKVTCPICFCKMELHHCHLHSASECEDKVLFYYRCEACKKTRAVFEDGAEYHFTSEKCPCQVDVFSTNFSKTFC